MAIGIALRNCGTPLDGDFDPWFYVDLEDNRDTWSVKADRAICFDVMVSLGEDPVDKVYLRFGDGSGSFYEGSPIEHSFNWLTEYPCLVIVKYESGAQETYEFDVLDTWDEEPQALPVVPPIQLPDTGDPDINTTLEAQGKTAAARRKLCPLRRCVCVEGVGACRTKYVGVTNSKCSWVKHECNSDSDCAHKDCS